MQSRNRLTNFYHSINVEKDRTAAEVAVIQGEFLVYIRETRYQLFPGK
jgi:hypothetical protein